MTFRRLRTPALLLGLAALAACSAGPSHPRGAPPPPASVAVTPAEVDAVLDLLLRGREDDARNRLKQLLKRDPMSPSARLLSDSIERDPKELLGPASYPYTVRAGDEPVALTQRLLGNRLKVYQLLRYNGLRAPVTLTPGQVLRIPGEPPHSEPVRRPDAPARPAPVEPRPTAKPKPPAPRPVVAVPTTNPAAARTARAAGLAALNAGAVERAVGLLRRASSLDPGNPVITRDLARAERIAATVRARR